MAALRLRQVWFRSFTREPQYITSASRSTGSKQHSTFMSFPESFCLVFLCSTQKTGKLILLRIKSCSQSLVQGQTLTNLKKKRILDIHGDNARQVGNDKENIWKCFHLNWLGISFMPENLKQRHRPKMTAIGGNSKGMICFRLGWSCRHSCWNCLCNVSIVLIVWCNRRK